MKELYEFRILEKFADRLFKDDEGKRLGTSVRKVTISKDDPRFPEIGRINEQINKELGRIFFTQCTIIRTYSKVELQNALLFNLSVNAVFEPSGEECGTMYDETAACPICGANRKQVSDLFLDFRKIPKTVDIARTIGDEIIISQRLAEAFLDAKITGIELKPVKHKAQYQDDAIDLSRVPSGRALLARAQQAGAPHPDYSFFVWLNRAEQKEPLERARHEYAEMMQRKEQKKTRLFPPWYQLVVTSPPVSIHKKTECGINPFDNDQEGKYRCPLGHTLGLGVMSEVYIYGNTWDKSDFACTKQMVGIRMGLYRPAPLMLISPRVQQILAKLNAKRYWLEIAHIE